MQKLIFNNLTVFAFTNNATSDGGKLARQFLSGTRTTSAVVDAFLLPGAMVGQLSKRRPPFADVSTQKRGDAVKGIKCSQNELPPRSGCRNISLFRDVSSARTSARPGTGPNLNPLRGTLVLTRRLEGHFEVRKRVHVA